MRNCGLPKGFTQNGLNGTTRAFSGHAQADTLTKHYITPESAAVREATNRAEKALLEEQKRVRKIEQ